MLALFNTTAANDKKIKLEDIEQDNLESEKLKQGRNKETFMQQTRIQYTPKHQYDVEEEEEQKAPRVVYAMKSNNYHPTEHRYIDTKRERENIHPENNVMYQHAQEANSINPTAPPNYVPMQVIYVPHYDPSASNHINAYAQQYQQVIEVPFYYHPVEPQNDQKYIVDAQPQIKYVTVPSTEEASEGYDEQKSQPLYHNYIGFVQNQAYANNLVEDQGPATEEHTQQEEVVEKRPSIIPIRPLPPVHVPRVLPQYAHEVSRPIYSHISGNLVKEQSVKVVDQDSHRPSHSLGSNLEGFVRRKPNSLLESYIPSSVQLEYLRRGLSKEPLATYDAVAQSHGFPVKNFERGFLPNQMYPTAGGGVTYGHFKRHVSNRRY